MQADNHEQGLPIQRTCRIVSQHLVRLTEINRHLEDLDNRGPRHNIRLQGLPVVVTADQQEMALLPIFNDILDRPLVTPIDMERFHRPLESSGMAKGPTKDVIYCLASLPLKEDIIHRAREKQQITYHDAPIQLFQDLSTTSLQHRRALQPLLSILRERNIPYRWRFPLCLAATTAGRTALYGFHRTSRNFVMTFGSHCQTFRIGCRTSLALWMSKAKSQRHRASSRESVSRRSPKSPRDRSPLRAPGQGIRGMPHHPDHFTPISITATYR